MALPGTFKVPKFKNKKSSILQGSEDIEKFDWANVTREEEIGRGSFGVVTRGTYTDKFGETRNVVVKELNDGHFEKEFLKEARLLDSVKGHENVVEFLGLATEPQLGLMQEYIGFSFHGFEDSKVTNSLGQFLQHVDKSYDFAGFEHLPVVIARDIAKGVTFLHDKDIVHRDLKPANILLGNRSYVKLSAEDFIERWKNDSTPVVCKLTDFGESRSRLIQTKTLISSKVKTLDRGSPAFMSPEILVPQLRPHVASLEDLKAADVWALGMVLFVVVNSSVAHPYQEEIETVLKACPSAVARDILEQFVREKKRPAHSTKYAVHQATSWLELVSIHKRCTDFDRKKRATSMEEVKNVSDVRPQPPCVTKNLLIHQGSALTGNHSDLVEKLERGETINTSHNVFNDGTNSCTFLALKMCDDVLSRQANGSLDAMLLGETLAELASDTIWNYPVILNPCRSINKIYTVIEAYVVMRDNKHLANELDVSEELPYKDGVFDDISRERLNQKLYELCIERKSFMSVFTSEPYTVIIGCVEGRLFILDTHSVSEELGGNGNAHIRLYESANHQSCWNACVWLWKRLALGGVKSDSGQSLAVIEPALIPKQAAASTPMHDAASAPMCDAVDEISGNDPSIMQTSRKTRISRSLSAATEALYDAFSIDSPDQTGSNDTTTSSSVHSKPECDVAEMKSIQSNRSVESSVVELDSAEIHSVPNQKYEKDYPVEVAYKGDACTPVFSWRKDPYDCFEIIRILCGDYQSEAVCIATPVNVGNNVTFLVDSRKLRNYDDVKCDDMGVWSHTGSPKRVFRVQKSVDGTIKDINTTEKGQCQFTDFVLYELKRMYYVNANDNNLRKIISTVKESKGNVMPYILVQYLFKGEEHEIKISHPHGNSNRPTPYRRLYPSIREKLKDSSSTRSRTPKAYLDAVYASVGDVTSARSIGELPRGPSDIYSARHAMKSTGSNPNQQDTSGLQSVWMLLEQAKRENELSKSSAFIRECTIHPSLFVFLANDRQLDELSQFCTDTREFCIFGIDPTFNIFRENISLTVTTYRNLRLTKRDTGKSPVFIGPLMMHQQKNWQAYSRFAHQMIAERPALESILACGTDGEKAIIDSKDE